MMQSRLFVGVDWYTATSSNDNVGLFWSQYVHRRKSDKGVSGLDVKSWRNKYYAGIDVAGLSWGYSERNGYIMIAKGEVALETWRDLLPTAARVTRLDIQCTVVLPESDPLVAIKAYRAAKQRKKPVSSLIQNSRDGQTLYIGSRHSDQYGRLYDKGVQSGEYKPGNMWRYEVEIKKPRADVLAAALIDRDKQGREIDVPVKSFVWNWFNSRGVKPMYKPSDNSLLVEVGKRVTTADRKLNWLRTQVRPTLHRLIEEGFGSEAIAALALDGPALNQLGLFDDRGSVTTE